MTTICGTQYGVSLQQVPCLTLHSLQLTEIAVQLDPLTCQAETEHWSGLTFLDHLTQCEVNARFERHVQRKLRLARFPFFRTLDQFDFAFQAPGNERQLRDLANLRFVAQAENVLFLGPPGLGKTHLVVSPGETSRRDDLAGELLANGYAVASEMKWAV